MLNVLCSELVCAEEGSRLKQKCTFLAKEVLLVCNGDTRLISTACIQYQRRFHMKVFT